MKKKGLAIFLTTIAPLLVGQISSAQTISNPKSVAPQDNKIAPRVSDLLAANLAKKTTISLEERQKSYAKLFEGQRYIILATRQRSANSAGWTLAKQAVREALEINPFLAEGYVTLAELALTTPPGDLEETIALAKLGVKVQPENFNAHRFLAFAYTIKTGLNRTPNLNPEATSQAISEWKTVTELSPRFAEGWAFLSAIYDKTNKNSENIEALKKWRASAPPTENRFYRAIMGDQATLAPEETTLKLGSALLKADRRAEAVEILSEAIADDPDNTDAVDLLKQAVESGDGKTSPATVQALQQAVYANQNNVSLIELLAFVQSKSGQIDAASKTLKKSIDELSKTDKSSAAVLQISLGDIYAGANRNDEAVTAYQTALKIQGIDKNSVDTEENREFVIRVYSKIIQAYKVSGKINEAKNAIQEARILLGNNDLFADQQNISLLRETGRKTEALDAVRALRAANKDDYSLLRLEATLLTELGQVDQAVKLVKTLIDRQPVKNSAANKVANGNRDTYVRKSVSPYYDDFTNYIFVSSLYNQAKRGDLAIEAAKQASAIAESEEKKQIADLSLATAQQTAGNFQSAEETLRGLLKKSPGNPVAMNNLGYFLLERNEKLDEALNLIKGAVSIDPTNTSYLDSLGWAYFKIGKLTEAETYLKEAARSESASAAVYEHLGDVYHKQAKTELARAAWQKAINISSNSETESRLKEKLANRALK